MNLLWMPSAGINSLFNPSQCLQIKSSRTWLLSYVNSESAKSARLLTPYKWQDVEKTSKQSIQERKIRVNFLPALDDTQPNGVVCLPRSHSTQPLEYQQKLIPCLISRFPKMKPQLFMHPLRTWSLKHHPCLLAQFLWSKSPLSSRSILRGNQRRTSPILMQKPLSQLMTIQKMNRRTRLLIQAAILTPSLKRLGHRSRSWNSKWPRMNYDRENPSPKVIPRQCYLPCNSNRTRLPKWESRFRSSPPFVFLVSYSLISSFKCI